MGYLLEWLSVSTSTQLVVSQRLIPNTYIPFRKRVNMRGSVRKINTEIETYTQRDAHREKN